MALLTNKRTTTGFLVTTVNIYNFSFYSTLSCISPKQKLSKIAYLIQYINRIKNQIFNKVNLLFHKFCCFFSSNPNKIPTFPFAASIREDVISNERRGKGRAMYSAYMYSAYMYCTGLFYVTKEIRRDSVLRYSLL
jgi:hypothetical protein